MHKKKLRLYVIDKTTTKSFNHNSKVLSTSFIHNNLVIFYLVHHHSNKI